MASSQSPNYFLLAANENWICDRFLAEWKQEYGLEDHPNDADIIWILSPYAWRGIPDSILAEKKVFVTIHHVVKEKFTKDALREFLIRDKIVDGYHVPCQQTYDFVSKITKKPIFIWPFWVNQDLWYPLDKQEARAKFGLSEDSYLVGSFQRDTEGHDLVSPKLEKGPDIFCDIIEDMHKDNPKLEVVLAGWRRQYVMMRLYKAGINHHYYELPPTELVNDFYNCLDLYIVAARCEGGPQAIVECALSKTPIISTKVGIAPLILPETSLFDDNYKTAIPDVESCYSKVEKHKIPKGFNGFKNFFESFMVE